MLGGVGVNFWPACFSFPSSLFGILGASGTTFKPTRSLNSSSQRTVEPKWPCFCKGDGRQHNTDYNNNNRQTFFFHR